MISRATFFVPNSSVLCRKRGEQRPTDIIRDSGFQESETKSPACHLSKNHVEGSGHFGSVSRRHERLSCIHNVLGDKQDINSSGLQEHPNVKPAKLFNSSISNRIWQHSMTKNVFSDTVVRYPLR